MVEVGAGTVSGSNLGTLTVATAVVSIVLCTAGVAARLFTRLRGAGQHLYLEDWILIGPAYIFTTGVACTMIVATTYKLGLHVNKAVDTDDIIKLMKTLYALQISLLIALGAVRASLLLFIRRLSETSSRSIYVTSNWLIYISTTHIIVSIFSSVFRCNPISTVWTLNLVTYTCTSLTAIYVLVIVGLTIDAAMFILPAILIVRLNMTIKKKLQSLVMFALGGGGCIIESLRFGQLKEAKKSHDPTYNGGKIVIFLFIQVVLGMLCCCAPAIKAFGARVVGSRFKGTDSIASISDNRSPNLGHDSGKTRYTGDDGESGIFGENSSHSRWEPRTETIELDTQGAGSSSNQNDKDGTTTVVGRIMDLEEVLKFGNDGTEERSLPVPQGNKATDRAWSDSSQTYEEFHAKPIEWGKQL